MRRFTFALALLALGSPGCTLLINGNQYVGSGVDAGPGHDAGPGNDGGPGNDSAVDSSVDSGPHGNTPPVVTTLGLDNYRPIAGETVRALAGRVYDADGDATSVHYQWYRNGTAFDGMTTATLDTHMVTIGDQIHVEAWANDGMVDGPHVSTSDVPVLDSVTQWRQLLPASNDNLPAMVWDAPNRRAVRYVDGGVWEYTVDGSNLRISRLPTTGTGPLPADDQIVLFDEGRRRFIVYQVSAPTSIYVLDISHRGGGTWMQTPTTGTAPTYLLLAVSFYDPSTHRIYVIGGKDDTMGAIHAVTALDVTSAGAESWTSVVPTGDMLPSLFGAAPVADPNVPGRFYLIGGVTSTVGTTAMNPDYTMLDHVIQLDTTATGLNVTVRSGTEPPSWGAVAAANAATGHIVVYGGASVFGLGATLVNPSVYDIAADTFSDLPGTPPHGALFGSMAPDPTAPGHFSAFTLGASLLTGGGQSFQYDDVSETGVTEVAQRIGPRAIVQAAARLIGPNLQVVGGTDGSAAVSTSWSLDVGSLQWSMLSPAADVATGHQPELRYGVLNDPSPYGTQQRLFQVGGARATAVLSDMAVYELDSTNHWIEHSLLSGSPPPPRVGAIVSTVNCGSGRVFVYGGEDAGGTVLGDGGELDCTADHACTWQTGTIDAGRSYAGAATLNQVLYVMGGRTAAGAASDVIAISTCSAGFPAPMAFTVNGPPPLPRYGHTFTPMHDVTGTQAMAILFGGTDGTTSSSSVAALTLDAAGTTGVWSTISPGGGGEAPLPRAYHIAVPDEMNRRILVAGGVADNGSYTINADDVWELVFRP